MFKKVLTVLAIAFAAYYLVTDPSAAAGAVAGGIAAVVGIFESIITFITELFQKLAEIF